MTSTARVRAPVRLDFAGGWTDVPPFSEEHGGVVVNAAIRPYTEVEVSAGDRGITLQAVDIDTVVDLPSRSDLDPTGPLGLLQAAVRRHTTREGLRLTSRSSTPLGSGLGTSGSLGTALVAALAQLEDRAPQAQEIAVQAWQLEARDCGLPGGRQDQYAAALGGFNLLSFHDPEVTITRLELQTDMYRELDRQLVVCYVGQSRVSGHMISRVMDGYSRGDPTIGHALRELCTTAHQMADALRGNDPVLVATLLSQNWRWQQELDPGMQTDAMRHVETAATDAGALGGKAAGAGAGGCMFFLAGDNPQAVRRAVTAAGATVLEVAFDDEGVGPW